MRKELYIMAGGLLALLLLIGFLGNRQSGENSKVTSALAVSSTGADAAEPAIAVDDSARGNGGVYVAWVEHAADKTADVYVRNFGADGVFQSVNGPVRVNPVPGQATAWRGDPPTIRVGADGAVYVGWTARVEGAASSGGNDLYLSISHNGGKTFEEPVKINDDTVPAVHGMHSLAVGDDGKIYMAWLDERYLKTESVKDAPMSMGDMPMKDSVGGMKHGPGEPNRELYFAVSNDNGKSFSPNKKIAGNACPCCKTALTLGRSAGNDSSGVSSRVYIAWRQVLEGDYRHIAVSSSADGGDSFTEPAIVSDDRWQLSACPVSGAALTADAADKLKIVWYTAGVAGVAGLYQAESVDGGKSFSPRILVSGKSASGTPNVATAQNGSSQIIFSTIDKNSYLLTSPKTPGHFNEQFHLDNAELPVAAGPYIAYIRNAGEKRNIYLVKMTS